MEDKNKFCVYLTIYSGNKLPPFYIGSGIYEKIKNKEYFGSVKSKKYSKIWNEELSNNRNLFKCIPLCYFNDRKQASIKEQKLQKLLNVVKSELYINMSVASPNGFFGMDVSGENNPNYGKKSESFDKTNYKKPKSKEHIQKLKKPKSKEHRENLSKSKIGKKENEQNKIKRCAAICKTYIALSPEKEIYIILGLPEFCKEKGLFPQNAGEVAQGKRKSCKKWKFWYYDSTTLEDLLKEIF